MSHLLVLEATIVVCLMVSAVAYVSTYDVPSGADARIERILETKGRDMLAILQDTPVVDDCGGRTELERIVIDGVNGEHDRWKARTAMRYAPGFETNLWLWNQHEYYPLHVREDFKGVTATQPLYPEWTWTKGVASVEQVSGLEHHDVLAYGLSQGRSMWLQGEAVEVGVDWTSLGAPPLARGTLTRVHASL